MDDGSVGKAKCQGVVVEEFGAAEWDGCTRRARSNYPCRVKYVIIIADGGADKPIAELGGKTPFDAARTPNLDRLAAAGRVGAARTTPPGFEAGSDVCSMDLLGYDPAKYHTGRAPLEAAALGLKLAPTDWIFRMNFVTVGEGGDAGLMIDHSAGAISDAEARILAKDLVAHWRMTVPELASDFALTSGVSYRNILVDSRSHGKRKYGEIKSYPPHEIPRRPWREHAPAVKPGAGGAEDVAGAVAMNKLMQVAGEFLPRHEVNRVRIAAGKRAANMTWIWGQGLRPNMPLFHERFGLERGAMTTAVDLLAGIALLIGWEKLDVPGVTSYHDNDYGAQGRATCEAIGRNDIVCCHVESPDEASHQGDWKTKLATVESIDSLVVGPVAEHLQRAHKDDWRVLVLPDHYTLVTTRKHDPAPVPWMMSGKGIGPKVDAGRKVRFTEAEADLCKPMSEGYGLMELFLRGTTEDMARWA